MNKLLDGDYCPDKKGGFVRLTGAEQQLAEAMFRLQCRRGMFPFLPELGSRLYLLSREKPSARRAAAGQYCLEALEGLNVELQSVRVTAVTDTVISVAVRLAAGGISVEQEVLV